MERSYHCYTSNTSTIAHPCRDNPNAMPSSTGVYRSEPAFPILAHSMLTPSFPSMSTGNQSQPSHDGANSWNLRSYLEKGIECSTDSVVRTGTVIGLSRVRTRNRDDDSESIGQVRLQLLSILFLCSKLIKYLINVPACSRSTLQTSPTTTFTKY